VETLSLVTTQYGDTLALWCTVTRKWYRYSDGEYVRGTVHTFRPIKFARWWRVTPEKMLHWNMEGRRCLVQFNTGRYAVVVVRDGKWVSSSTGKPIRDTVLCMVPVDTLLRGRYKLNGVVLDQ
jgi:hypothetical protein